MKIEELRSIYAKNQAVKAICDHFADRSKNQNETALHRMLMHLEADGYDFPRRDVIAAFRALEGAECGRYVEGRHGWKSRFVWSVKSLLIADAAKGTESVASLEAQDDEDSKAVEDDLIEHSFWLRPDLSVTIELPGDLSPHEAYRLSQFVSALSFEE